MEAPGRRVPSDGALPRDGLARQRASRRAAAEALAARQGGVISRSQAYGLGLSRHEVRAHVRAGRWRAVRRQAVATVTGSLTPEGEAWAAVFEGGPRAHLDGASALIAAGLRNFTVERIRVSVPRGARIRRGAGLDVRQTRRWRVSDREPGGVPRTRNEVAAVHGALWAKSDKQAALLLTMAVQQRLVRAESLGVELLRVRRHRRRDALHRVVLDLMRGAQSLGELELGMACRRRGLPAPSRQVVRRGRGGRYFLDACWEAYRVVVEVDGIHHAWAQNIVGDALRHNDLALEGAIVLRLPLLGFRVAEDAFLDQIESALRAQGWTG